MCDEWMLFQNFNDVARSLTHQPFKKQQGRIRVGSIRQDRNQYASQSIRNPAREPLKVHARRFRIVKRHIGDPIGTAYGGLGRGSHGRSGFRFQASGLRKSISQLLESVMMSSQVALAGDLELAGPGLQLQVKTNSCLPSSRAKIFSHSNCVIASPGPICAEVGLAQVAAASTKPVKQEVLGYTHLEALAHVDGGAPGMFDANGVR